LEENQRGAIFQGRIALLLFALSGFLVVGGRAADRRRGFSGYSPQLRNHLKAASASGVGLRGRFGSGRAAVGTPTVGLGQTTSQVAAILGTPKQIIDLGSKEIYRYPDMKVVFIDGKVSDVE
jgi:hypothetical protein